MGRRNHPRNGVVFIKVLGPDRSVDQVYELDEHGKLKVPIADHGRDKLTLTQSAVEFTRTHQSSQQTSSDFLSNICLVPQAVEERTWDQFSVGTSLTGLDVSVFDMDTSELFF